MDLFRSLYHDDSIPHFRTSAGLHLAAAIIGTSVAVGFVSGCFDERSSHSLHLGMSYDLD